MKKELSMKKELPASKSVPIVQDFSEELGFLKIFLYLNTGMK